MTTIAQLVEVLDSIAPFRLQESYDNARLLTGNPQDEVKGVLCTLDSLESTVEEASAKNCNVIVAHHPILFSGLKSLTGETYIQRTIIRAIQLDIAILAVHTNLDSIHPGGVNSRLASILGIENTEIVAPHASDPTAGLGLVGNLSQGLTPTEFCAKLKKDLDLECFKYTPIELDKIHRIAVCGGSGSFLLAEARKKGAQAFVTSDFKYHQFFDNEGDIMICDIGHYESEKHTIALLQEHIKDNFSTFAVLNTELDTNPIKYYT